MIRLTQSFWASPSFSIGLKVMLACLLCSSGSQALNLVLDVVLSQKSTTTTAATNFVFFYLPTLYLFRPVLSQAGELHFDYFTP